MIWVFIVMIILTLCLLVLKRNSIYSMIFSVNVIAVSVIMVGFLVYISIALNYKYYSRVEYYLYKYISNLSINLFDIHTILNIGIVLFGLGGTAMSLKNDTFFKGRGRIIFYIGFYLIAAINICILNSKYFLEKIYLMGYTSTGLEVRIIQIFVKAWQTLMIGLTCFFPLVNIFRQIKNTGIVFRKRFFLSVLAAYSMFVVIILAFLYLMPTKFFFNNFNIYNFRDLYLGVGYDFYYGLSVFMLFFITAAIILLLRYDVFDEKSFFKQNFKRKYYSVDMSEIRHVFHSFKNALFSISGLSQMAMDSEDIKEIKHILKKIQNCADNYKKQIGDFLNIFNYGKSGQNFFNMQDCIREAEKMVIIPTGIKVEKNIQTVDDIIDGNQNDFTEVFCNIFHNSIDALMRKNNKTDPDRVNKSETAVETEKEPYIKVGLWNEEKFLCIIVEDNGIGIPKKALKKVFSPFYSTKQTDKNYGLGLSHVKTVVESYGGYIYICSKLGVYTKIEIIIPIGNAK